MTNEETRVVRPGLYAEGARAVFRPRRDGDPKPWEVDSRWYDIHNGERYADEDVCTSEEYMNKARPKQ